MITAKAALMLAIVALGAAVIGWGTPGSVKDQASECTTSTCYSNPSFWITSVNSIGGGTGPLSGTCTTSGTYVNVDGNHGLTITTPSTTLQPIQAYVIYDFDVHVTAAGTAGKIALYDTLGIGISVSRDMVISGIGLGTEESGTLQMTLGPTSYGSPISETFDVQALRTAGVGQVCLDDFEAFGYFAIAGGTPAT